MIPVNIPAWLRLALYISGAVAAKVGDYLLAKGVFGKPEADLCSWLASGALVLAIAHTVTRADVTDDQSAPIRRTAKKAAAKKASA